MSSIRQRNRSISKMCIRDSIIFHGFGHTVPADNQHMRTAEQVTAHVDAAFMLLGNKMCIRDRACAVPVQAASRLAPFRLGAGRGFSVLSL